MELWTGASNQTITDIKQLKNGKIPGVDNIKFTCYGYMALLVEMFLVLMEDMIKRYK